MKVLRALPDASVDSVVTNPPAGIEFMGKDWDSFKGDKRQPGDSTFHKSGAGPFDRATVRYGYSKDKIHSRDLFVAFLTEIMAECLRVAKPGSYALVWAIPRTSHWTGTAIEDAGWVIQDRISHLFGQGFPKHRSKLKPACEDWWLAWKPDRYATPLPGLDACRIEVADDDYAKNSSGDRGHDDARRTSEPPGTFAMGGGKENALGRWPANVTLDEEAAAMLDEATGQLTSGTGAMHRASAAGYAPNAYGKESRPAGTPCVEYGDTGGASRFFYVAKASKRDREEGNTHPTVKPIELCKWLCRLITPPNGTVLDCFMGSGSIGIAALEEKLRFVGIEREASYFEIAKTRIAAPAGPLFAEGH